MGIEINYLRHEFEGFEPIDETHVLLYIVDYKVSNLDKEQIEFKFSVKSGSKKGYYVYDYIHFVPFKTTSYKLPKLLSAINKNFDGPLRFDTLIGVSLVCNFRRSERSDKVYQDILYQPHGTKHKNDAAEAAVTRRQMHGDSPFW